MFRAMVALFVAGLAVAVVANASTAAAGRVTFSGAILAPAGGLHPQQPLIARYQTVQVISDTRMQVDVIIYQ